MQQQSDSDWELCKENIQPLRKGRKMENIKSALLDADSDLRRAAILVKQREHEVAIRTYAGSDPLEPWWAYIGWTEQNFPKGGKESHLLELLEKCIVEFYNEPRYHNDARFVRIWLSIADMNHDPIEIYEYMFNQGIGCKLAPFYRDYALYLESLGNLRKAEEVFREGLRHTTETKDELNGAYTNFLTRLANKFHESNTVDDDAPDESNQRTILGGLRVTGTNHVGPTRTGAAKLSNRQGLATQVSGLNKHEPKFPVFSDENGANCGNHIQSAPTKVAPLLVTESRKENDRNPVKWTQAKVKQKGGCTTPGQCNFAVHVDEVVPVKASGSIGFNTGRLSSAVFRPGPLTPDCAALRNSNRPSVIKAIQQQTLDARVKPLVRLVYHKEKLFRGVTELQFEELRAAKWFDNRKRLEAEQKEENRRKQQQLCAELVQLQRIIKKTSIQEDVAKRLDNIAAITAELFEGSCSSASHPSLYESGFQGGEVEANLQNSTNPHTKTLHCMRALWNDTSQSVVDGSQVVANPAQLKEPKISQFVPYEDEDVCRVATGPLPVYEDDEARRASTCLPAVGAARDGPLKQLGSCLGEKGQDVIGHKEVERVVEQPLPSDGYDFPADVENIQNIPPDDYVQQKCDRTMAGILVPSLSVPYLPLEEQELLAEGCDLDGVQPLNGFLPTDVSVSGLTNTMFLTNLKCASTPNVQMENTKPMKDVATNSGPRFSKKWSGQTGPLVHRARDLSAISEASREYKSSSSSGASSEATSHFRSQFTRNEVLVENSVENDVTTETSKGVTCPAAPPLVRQPDIDPFDDGITDSVLKRLAVPVKDRDGYVMLPNNMPNIRERISLVMGNETYFIKQLKATGGFSKVYTGAEVGDDFNLCPRRNVCLAFKVQKPSCEWEFYIASELRSRLKQLAYDFDIMASVMEISNFYVYKNGSILVTDYHSKGTLLDLVNLYMIRGNAMPESLILYFTIELLHIIEQFHACQIIHADVKPDNFLVMILPLIRVGGKTSGSVIGNSTQALKLIDYGQSIDMTAFPAGTTFTSVVKTSGFQCHEMREGQPWTYQLDYYGLACCTHVMMFGTYMKTVKEQGQWRITSGIKRYWQREVWENYFNCLLNVPNCQQQPSLQALRESLQRCLMTDRLLTDLTTQIGHLRDMLPSKF